MLSQAQQIIQDYEQALARVILYSVSESPLSLGMSKTIGILKGAKSTFFIERNLHRLASYGVLPTFTKEYLQAVIGVLVECGLLEIEMVSECENLPTLKLTVKGREFLAKTANFEMPFVEKLADKEVIELNEQEQVLFEALRQIRLRIAVAKGLPAYTICHDTMLREMAKTKPITPEGLLTIRGIGEKFVQNYGEFFLESIKQNGI